MATREIVVAYDHGGAEKRATVQAERVEQDHDGTVRCYDDGTEVATFYTALFVVENDHMG